MRFMVIVKANKDSEAGVLPSEQMLAEMGTFNEEMIKAGILLAADGLQSSAKGKRIRFPERAVIDGPFPETKELIAGFWMIKVKSMDEAVAWMKRCPNPYPHSGEIEIRQVFEPEDFLAPELLEEAKRQHDQMNKNAQGR